uniref:Uncharacterized protein n=2 Tax=Caenorhabditis japonica TaxID=281687 RepID=A0A8R1I954_CAEJA
MQIRSTETAIRLPMAIFSDLFYAFCHSLIRCMVAQSVTDCPTPPIRHPPDTVKRRANDFKFVAFYPICSDGGDAVGYGDDCDWRNGKRIINHGGYSRNSENGAKAKKNCAKTQKIL